MKKQTYCALSMLLLMGVLSSCKEEVAEIKQSEGQTIKLYVKGIETRTTNGELNQTYITANNTVGAFGVTADGNYVSNGNNNLYIAGVNGKLIPDSNEMTVSDENTTVKIYAYAPYNESWAQYDQEYEFNIQTDQSTNERYLASDLLSSTGSTYSGAQEVGLTFNHMLSRVRLVIQKGADSFDLSNASITLNTQLNTLFNPSTGVINGQVEEIETSEIIMQKTIGSSTAAYCIVVPQTVSSETTLFTINNGEKSYTCNLESDFTFESGKSYTFTATVNSNDIVYKIGKPTVEDWEDGDQEDEETEEVTLDPTYFWFERTGTLYPLDWDKYDHIIKWNYDQIATNYIRLIPFTNNFEHIIIPWTKHSKFRTLKIEITDFKFAEGANNEKTYITIGTAPNILFVDSKSEIIKINEEKTYEIDLTLKENKDIIEEATEIIISARAEFNYYDYNEYNTAIINNVKLRMAK
ncbi:MAG: fimbrillin family protein [Muribaculaceae bacterium]|nr:fimbrillin family protein [Muribaculaceae bacterium]